MFLLLATALSLSCNQLEIERNAIEIWRLVEEAQYENLEINEIADDIKYRLIMIGYHLHGDINDN